MSETSGDSPSTGSPDAIGLSLLLSGGLADALAMAEATLGVMQAASRQMMAGYAQAQMAGAMALSLPAPAPAADPAAVGGPPPAPGVPAPVAQSAAIPEAAVTVPVAPAAASPPAPSLPVMAFVPPPIVTAEAGAPVMPAAPAPATAAPVQVASFAPMLPGAAPVPQVTANVSAAPDVAQAPQAAAAPAAWASPERHATRASIFQPAQTAPGVAGDDGAPIRAMAPPPSRERSGGPTAGDVFLDGTRMGTWLADHLAEEAGRPQSGSTGFDSRMTPAWPGTLQGG